MIEGGRLVRYTTILAAALLAVLLLVKYLAPGAEQLPSATSSAQPSPTPLAFENLQVFPKDIKREQLFDQMHEFSDGLGVGCNYCHAEGKPPPWAPPGEKLQFSLDTNPKKQIARQMVGMLRSINAMVPMATGKAPGETVRFQCFNCHRGMPTPPLPLGTLLAATTAEKGTAAAVAQFKELRRKYYGAAAYDFSEGDSSDPANARLGGLGAHALRLIQSNRPDEALVWIDLNFEYYPKSASNWALRSLALQGKNDKTAAIGSAQKAVELAPELPQFRDLLRKAMAMP